MTLPDLIDLMVAEGVSVHVIAATVRAFHACPPVMSPGQGGHVPGTEGDKLAQRRERDRLKKQRQRAKAGDGDMAGQSLSVPPGQGGHVPGDSGGQVFPLSSPGLSSPTPPSNQPPIIPRSGIDRDSKLSLSRSAKAKSPVSADGLDEEFELFWSAYPRKAHKSEARLAFAKAARRTAPKSIIAALEAHLAAGMGDAEMEFIPHAASWLNKGRHLNEPERRQPRQPYAPPARKPLTALQQLMLEAEQARQREAAEDLAATGAPPEFTR